MHSVRSNNRILKYQRFKPLACKNIGKRKFEFVTKTHNGVKEILKKRLKIKFLYLFIVGTKLGQFTRLGCFGFIKIYR